MIFAYMLALHTLTHGQVVTKEIPVLRTRPSRLLTMLRTAQGEDSTIKADDERGVIIVKGSADEIADAQTMINLLDIQRRQVKLQVNVRSPIDKLSYEASASIVNQQMWRTSDGDIGVNVGITPRLNDDNTVTLFIEIGTDRLKKVSDVARVKMGSSITLSVGKNRVDFLEGPEAGETHIPTKAQALNPTVKITVPRA